MLLIKRNGKRHSNENGILAKLRFPVRKAGMLIKPNGKFRTHERSVDDLPYEEQKRGGSVYDPCGGGGAASGRQALVCERCPFQEASSHVSRAAQMRMHRGLIRGAAECEGLGLEEWAAMHHVARQEPRWQAQERVGSGRQSPNVEREPMGGMNAARAGRLGANLAARAT